MTRTIPPRRRGVSLIEQLVVITALGTLFGLVTALAYRMLRVDQGERARVVAAAALVRLGQALRLDARAATGPAEVMPDRLTIPVGEGRVVTYRATKGEVIRDLGAGREPARHESYRLPPGTTCRFEPVADGPRPLVAAVLRLDPAASVTKPGDSVYRDVRIEAALGRDARLLAGRSK